MRSLLDRFRSGSRRSVRLREQVLYSFFFTGTGKLAGLLTIPLALAYLDETRFGIWLTLSSAIGWLTFLDLGLGNGLRNRLAEARARDESEKARNYVSTAYFLIALIAGGVILLFLLVHPWVDWAWLFNAPKELSQEVTRLMYWVPVLFFLKFAFEPISKVVLAEQRPGLNAALRSCGRLLVVLIIFLLGRTGTDSLLLFGCSVQGVQVLVPLLAGIILFKGPLHSLRPSFSRIDLSLSRDLLGLGFKFFVMQLAAIVVFATDNMIITQLFGPAEVTPYQIAFRYFTIALLLFRILSNPYWSAYTDAYQRGELDWIRNATRKLIYIWIALLGFTLLMLLISGPAYRFWVGEEHAGIPVLLSLFMAAWVSLSSFTTIFGNFLNGVGKVRLSMLHSVVFMILNIPLSVFLAKGLELGPKGVILGTFLSILPQGILHPIQYRKVMKGTAKGIWDR